MCGLAYFNSPLWVPKDCLAFLHLSLQSPWVFLPVPLFSARLASRLDLRLAVT